MAAKGPRALLIIDGEAPETAFLGAMLEKGGYSVTISNVNKSDLPPSLPPADLLLLSIDSGFSTCRKLFKVLRSEDQTRTLPIIILADREKAQDALREMWDDDTDLVFKPFAEPELLHRARSLLKLSRLRKDLQLQKAGFQRELDDRLQAENALKLNEDRLDALLSLSEQRSQSEEDLNHYVLDSCVRLTGSALGYLHYVNTEENGFDSYVWSKGAAEACAARKYMDFSLTTAGLWAECMRQRGPVICNEYATAPKKRGLPEGHIPIKRILSIPIMKSEKIVAVLGVANKPTPYNEADQRQLMLFGNRLWSIIEGKRIEIALEKANAELSRLARTDSLTGLANRRTLGEFLSLEWESCSRKSEPMALFMIDIDFFKRYNDTYGHQAGDDVLRKVSKVISDELEGSAMLAARYGGDEFSAVLPGADSGAAIAHSESILKRVRALKIPHALSEAGAYVSVSIGIAALIPSPEIDSDSLARAADTALYEAKKRGRDRACLSADQARAMRRE